MAKKSKTKIIAIIISAITAFIIIGADLYVKFKLPNEQVINLDNEQVPSISKLQTKKTLVGMNSQQTQTGGIIKTYVYRDNDISFSKDIYDYYLLLCDKENFEFVKEIKDLKATSGALEIGKKSQDDGKIIVVDIYYSQNGFEIQYRKDFGNINYK